MSPEHDKVYRPFDGSEPDVDPATGDERETTGPTAADLRRLEGWVPSENQLALGRYLAKCGNSDLSGFW